MMGILLIFRLKAILRSLRTKWAFFLRHNLSTNHPTSFAASGNKYSFAAAVCLRTHHTSKLNACGSHTYIRQLQAWFKGGRVCKHTSDVEALVAQLTFAKQTPLLSIVAVGVRNLIIRKIIKDHRYPHFNLDGTNQWRPVLVEVQASWSWWLRVRVLINPIHMILSSCYFMKAFLSDQQPQDGD
jgi:hypothetical protein